MKITSFQNKLRKAGRIVSEAELKQVRAAKKDVGTSKTRRYSKIAQRKVPKALHSLCVLPMKNSKRQESKIDQFLSELRQTKNK